MKQGSRARHNPDSHLHSGSGAPDPGALGLATLDREDPPRPGRTEHPPRPHLEDDFFARGEEIGSVPPSFVDAIEEEAVRRTIPPAVLARRARMRRIVGSAVGGAAVLTALVIAKALWTTRAAPPASDGALSVRNVVVPSIALAQEPARAPAVAEPSPDPAPNTGVAEKPAAEEAKPRVLPVINIEVPAPSDVATERAREAVAELVAARDFTGADKPFAALGRRSDLPTRETARLARAMWWMEYGRGAEVRPVLADLAANATTPYVQRHARELLRAD